MGVVADPAGTRVLRARATGNSEDPEELGKRVATELLRQGARKLLSHPELDPK